MIRPVCRRVEAEDFTDRFRCDAVLSVVGVGEEPTVWGEPGVAAIEGWGLEGFSHKLKETFFRLRIGAPGGPLKKLGPPFWEIELSRSDPE